MTVIRAVGSAPASAAAPRDDGARPNRLLVDGMWAAGAAGVGLGARVAVDAVHRHQSKFVAEDAARGQLSLQRDPAERSVVERALRSGRTVAWHGTVGGEGNISGALRVLDREDPETGTVVRAIEKRVHSNSHLEELASVLADRAGIGHLVPVAVRPPDGALDGVESGAALLEHVPGRPFGDTKFFATQGALDRVLRGVHELARPDMSKAANLRAARIDRQLAQVLDYVLANDDRHIWNVLRDPGRVSLIDWGYSGMGTKGPNKLEPQLRNWINDTSDLRKRPKTVRLDDAIVDYLRQHLPAGSVRSTAIELKTPVSKAFLDGAEQRLAHVLEHGRFTFIPRR
jgi:hypothetical protein